MATKKKTQVTEQVKDQIPVEAPAPAQAAAEAPAGNDMIQAMTQLLNQNTAMIMENVAKMIAQSIPAAPAPAPAQAAAPAPAPEQGKGDVKYIKGDPYALDTTRTNYVVPQDSLINLSPSSYACRMARLLLDKMNKGIEPVHLERLGEGEHAFNSREYKLSKHRYGRGYTLRITDYMNTIDGQPMSLVYEMNEGMDGGKARIADMSSYTASKKYQAVLSEGTVETGYKLFKMKRVDA